MRASRRNFLKQGVTAIPAVGLISQWNSNTYNTDKLPVVVSTWDSGMPVNEAAWEVLGTGGKAIDAVERGANQIEDTINCCVGLGGNPDREGFVTLDACIMDENYNCGSVSFLQKFRHPTSIARKVMELTPHVMLVGEGARQFALSQGFSEESGKLSDDAAKEYQKWLQKSEYKPVINIEQNQGKGNHHKNAPKKLSNGEFNHDTMGLVALDINGNLSGACTTSGMGFKMHGRVGDSPLIGGGLYVDNTVGAATSSGQGEEVIRICGTHLVVEFMRMGHDPEIACRMAIERLININPVKAKDFQVGFLALRKDGRYGAFSIHPGFSYSVKSSEDTGKVYMAPSYF